MDSTDQLAARLHRHMQIICTTLQGIGYESAVIVASSEGNHSKMGSKGGLQFLERFDLVTDFLWFCQDGGYFLQTPEATGNTADNDVRNPDAKTCPEMKKIPHEIKIVPKPQSKLVHHSNSNPAPNPESKQTLCIGSELETQLEIKQKPQPVNQLLPRPDIKLVAQPEAKSVPRVLSIRVPRPGVKLVLKPQSKLVPSVLSKQLPQSERRINIRSEMKTQPCFKSKLSFCPKKNFVPGSIGKLIPDPERITNDVLYIRKGTVGTDMNKTKATLEKRQGSNHEVYKITKHEVKLVIPPDSKQSVTQVRDYISEPATVIQEFPSADGEAVARPVLFVTYNEGKQVTSPVKQPEIGQMPYTDTEQMLCPEKEPVQHTLERESNDTISSENDPYSNRNSMGSRKRKLAKKTKKKNSYDPAKTVKCEHCDRKFSCARYLQKHKRRCTNTRIRFKCVHCEKDFFSMTALIQHEVVHDDTNCRNCYQCDMCNREYPKFYSLNRHFTRTHSQQHSLKQTSYKYGASEETFQCDKCNQTFYFAHALYTHKQKMHAHEKLSLKCVNCDKEFKYIISLMKHEATAHKAMTSRNYHHCNECGRKFVTFCSFYKHRRNFHNGIPYKPPEKCLCTICGKRYSRFMLKRHIEQIHSSIKYTCKICSKSFKSASYLKVHESTHSGATNRYVCDTCGFTTRHGSCLLRHKIRHSKVRPHKCEVCERSYAFQYELLAHKRRNHTGYQKATSQ